MKNQKGFTIVELLIGITILSIVAVALTGFIVSSSKSYAAANTEIMVQQESQLAMNQMSDVIIDTTRSVNYVGYSLDGSSEQVVKDADFTIDVEDKSLVLYNGEGTVVVDADGNPVLDADGNPEILKDADDNPIITGGNGNKNYQIYWDKSEEKLFFSEIDISDMNFPESDRVLLAEYVKDFSVDLSQVEEKRVVKLSISYGYNNKVYETSNNITIRNKVLVNSINLAVNRTVELSVRVKETMVVLEPGEDYYKFSTPIIDGRNILDKSVTWSIPDEEQSKLTAGWDTRFTDPANGIIHISEHENADSFKVRVTTNMADSAGNQAWAEVTVYVKRAKWISLHKSADSDSSNGPNEISPGCTFTIAANVEGNKLGVTCSKCGDDVEIDRQVVYEGNPYGDPYVWILADVDPNDNWNPYDHVELLESKPNSSTWRVKPDIPDDGSFGFVIQCVSLLSEVGNDCGRHYDWWVTGAISMTVTRKGDLTLEGNFRYGDEPLTLTWDYPHSYGLVCVRIKEEDENAPMANDKVMIFNTDGYAIRIGADLFGLDLNKNYFISMQVLDYQLDKNSWDYETKRNELVAEYLGHLDSTGTYTGEIKASTKLTVPLMKPQITFVYNNKEYTGEEINMSPISTLQGGVDISCPAIKVSSTRDEGERVKNDIKVNLYQGSGEKLYYYDVSTGQYVDTTYAGGKGAFRFNECSMHKADTLKVYLDGNGNMMEAAGSYYYIPFFKYSNKPDASRFVVHYVSPNHNPDYDEHYYERPESRINFTIMEGGNLSLWANTDANNNKFVNGEIYFPTPSESKFREYFTLKNPAVQSTNAYNYFKLKGKDGNIYGFSFSKMNCRYIPTEDAYEIELFYICKDSLWDRQIEVSAGVFKCSANGREWNRVRTGTLDYQLNNGNMTVAGNGNAKITIARNDIDGLKAGTYDACIALPTDSVFTQKWWGGFGFDLNEIKSSGGNFVEANLPGGATVSYKIVENGVPTVKTLRCASAKCKYDAEKQTYTLEIECYGPNDWSSSSTFNLGTFTYKEGGTSWE